MNPLIPLGVVAIGTVGALAWARYLGYSLAIIRRDRRGRFCK